MVAQIALIASMDGALERDIISVIAAVIAGNPGIKSAVIDVILVIG